MNQMAIATTSEITVRAVQQCGGDHMIAAAARVSVDSEAALQLARDGAGAEVYGLIRYLMKQRHGSPFEHSFMTFYVHAPIFVFREWHRHRVGFSYNERSGRYSRLEPVFWVPRDSRPIIEGDGFKASRPQHESGDAEQVASVRDHLARTYAVAWRAYESMCESSIAREVARACLPVGIYSACWVSCNPRSLMHFLGLRTRDNRAKVPSYPQLEIEEAARACEQVLATGWPLVYQAFNECGRVAP